MAAKPFDPTLKALVESSPEDWPVFVGQPPAPTEVIDADVATVSGAADKVLRVRAAPPYLLHLEFQAGHDAVALPGLLHLRNALLDERHGLPVRSAAVLLRPAADSPTLTGVRARGFDGEAPHDVFRYQVIRVWQLPAEALLAGGLGTLPLAPIGAATETELPVIIERMKERLGRRAARARAAGLWASTFILLGLRYSKDAARDLLRGVLTMRESTTYMAILEEGMAEGITKGAIAEAKKFLLLFGTDRLGPPDAAVNKALDRINDLTRLEALGERLLRATSWQELLDLPAPRRRNGKRQKP